MRGRSRRRTLGSHLAAVVRSESSAALPSACCTGAQDAGDAVAPCPPLPARQRPVSRLPPTGLPTSFTTVDSLFPIAVFDSSTSPGERVQFTGGTQRCQAWYKHDVCEQSARDRGELAVGTAGDTVVRACPQRERFRDDNPCRRWRFGRPLHIAQTTTTRLNYVAYYFVRIHRSARITPAMAANVTGWLVDVSDIVRILEESASKKAA